MSINNAVRCTIPVLSAVKPVPFYIQSHALARSLLWRTHVIGLKSIKGEYDHISKCWTLISKGWSHCLSILWQRLIALLEYTVLVYTDIDSVILLLQWLLLLYSVFNLIQFSELDSLYQRASSRARSPIFKLLLYRAWQAPSKPVWSPSTRSYHAPTN